MPRFPARRARPESAFASLAFVACAAAALPLAACNSAGKTRAEEGPARTRALRVRFVDWRNGQNLVLVDQSHTDRTAFYSEKLPLEQAITKVTTDEVLEETLVFFREQGYFERAAVGPAVAGSKAAQSLEVETPEGTVHMDLGPGTSERDGKVFRQCRDNFAALYNSVYQLQSVDRIPTWETRKKAP